MYRNKALTAWAAMGAAALLTLSACGSSGDSATASGNDPHANGTTASSDPHSSVKAKILVTGDFTSTIPFTLPEIVPMVKGVLKDFPGVQIETCDAKGTAPGFLACEQQAVVDKVAGAVVGFSGGGQDMSILTKAKIPVLGTGDAHSPNSYPVSESFSQYVALGAGLEHSGCTKLGIIYLDGSDFLVNYIKEGFEGLGGKEVARAAVAANAADLSPAVAKVVGAGAQCVAISLAPTGAAQALTALKQSGAKVTVGGISAVFSQQVLGALGPLTDGLLVTDSQLNADDPSAGVQQAKTAMQAVEAKAPLTEQALTAFVSAKILAAAFASATGSVDAAGLTKALDGLRNVDVDGVIPPWSTVPLDSKTFSRIFNHYGITYKVESGKPVSQGTFYDISSLLTGK